MAPTLLPDELARAVTALRGCYQAAAQAGYRPAHAKELLKLLVWLEEGAPAAPKQENQFREPVLPGGMPSTPLVDRIDTLRAAQETLKQLLPEGTTCQLCGQFAKIYKRKLNTSMAQSLVLLYRYFEEIARADPALLNDAWVHVPDFLTRTMANGSVAGGDATKLRYWGLLVPRPKGRADGSQRQGFYRLTPLGEAFVRGEQTVAKHVYLYNDQLLGFSDEQITIKDALADRFDYQELMTRST